MPTDINISQLIINKLTKEQYNEAQAAGNISESELYFITDDAGSEMDMSQYSTTEQMNTAINTAIESAFANIARAEEVSFGV